MRRLWALCISGLAAAAGCTLDFGQNDQTNDGDADLPGEAYRQCVLATLQQCDDQDLTPNECTALIVAQCTDNGCETQPDGTMDCPPPCDPNTDPMGCPPPPPNCYQTVFDACIAQGLDPMTCAVQADMTCNPQCQPGDPNCDPCPLDTMNPDGSCPPPPCDPMTGQWCCQDPTDPNCQPPPPCDSNTDPMCPPPPDCWTTTFNDCLSWGMLSNEECAAYADQVCYPPPPPPPCDPANDPTCCQNSMDPVCWDPCFFDPTLPGCQPCDPNTGVNCDPCELNPMDPACWDPCWTDPTLPGCPCDTTMDPNCMPPPDPCSVDPTLPGCCNDPTGQNCDPCDVNPMDPACQPPPCQPGDPSCMPPPCDPATDPMCPPPPPPDCQMGDPNCGFFP